MVNKQIRSRRGIHVENSAEGHDSNKQVWRQCCICKRDLEIFEDEELVGESGKSRFTNRNDKIYPDLSELADFICEKCRENERKKENCYSATRNLTDNRIRFLISFIMLGGMIYIGYIIYNYKYAEKTFEVRVKNQTQDEIDFDDELYGLENVYKQQEERVWYTFAAGIKSVIAENPNKPSVFLLLYDDDVAENTLKCLTQDVTRAASKYLMKQEIKPLIYAGSELNKKSMINDPGQLLIEYEEPLKRRGAMIVTNLEDVHPEVAASFHFLCDRYSPLVEKAIFIFTLKLNNIPNAPLQKVAEDALQNLWAKDLPENKLHPLITRMTGNVLKIFSDYSNCYR